MASPNMVVTRTPLRVSFLGGGSDMPEFYKQQGQGQVVSLALNRYIYVVVKRHAKIFGEKYRLSYSKNEIVENLNDIENNVIRENIRLSDITEPLYIATFSDIPAASGLGSSSSLSVGLLNALHAMKNEPVTRNQLAEEACFVEINRLNQPIGKQDQYTAAFGGLNRFFFNSDETVTVGGINLSPAYLSQFLSSASLYWTGLTRQVSDILGQQKKDFSEGKLAEVSEVAAMVPGFVEALEDERSVKDLAAMVLKSWQLKKRFADTISNPSIDTMFDGLQQAGGLGGKLCGAGGGGFILMFHEAEKGRALLNNMDASYYFSLGMDFSGSEVLMVN